MTGRRGSPIMLMGRDIRLLNFLLEAKLLVREQIQQLLDFKTVSRVNERLLLLHDAGLLRKYFLGTLAGGRKGVYALSPRGASTIGFDRVWKLQRTEGELLVGEAGVEHQLAVNWCWVSIVADPDSKLVRFTRFNEPLSQAIPLTPDGYAEMMGAANVQPFFLEVDLGTETSRIWERKIEMYLKLATSGTFEEVFHHPRFKVAVVCTSKRRLESLRRIVRKHTDKLFYFSLLETIKREGVRAPLWLRADGDTSQSLV